MAVNTADPGDPESAGPHADREMLAGKQKVFVPAQVERLSFFSRTPGLHDYVLVGPDFVWRVDDHRLVADFLRMVERDVRKKQTGQKPGQHRGKEILRVGVLSFVRGKQSTSRREASGEDNDEEKVGAKRRVSGECAIDQSQNTEKKNSLKTFHDIAIAPPIKSWQKVCSSCAVDSPKFYSVVNPPSSNSVTADSDSQKMIPE